MASFPPIFPSASAAFAAVSRVRIAERRDEEAQEARVAREPGSERGRAPHGSLGVLQEHRQVHGRVRILQARDRERGFRAQPGIGRGGRAAREERIVRAAVLHAEEARESEEALAVRAFRRALLGAERDTAREDDGGDERGGRARAGGAHRRPRGAQSPTTSRSPSTAGSPARWIFRRVAPTSYGTRSKWTTRALAS